MLEDAALHRLDVLLLLELEVLRDVRAHRVVLLLVELLLVVGERLVPEELGVDGVGELGLDLRVDPVDGRVVVLDELLRVRDELGHGPSGEVFPVRVAEVHLVVGEPRRHRVVPDLHEGGLEHRVVDVAFELVVALVERVAALLKARLQVGEPVPVLDRGLLLDDHYGDALLQLVPRVGARLLEEVEEHLVGGLGHVLDFSARGQREGRLLEEEPVDRERARLPHAVLVVAQQVLALVGGDVAFLVEAVDVALEPRPLGRDDVVDLAVHEPRPRVARGAHLVLERLVGFLADVELRLDAAGLGVGDLGVEHVGDGPGEEALVELDPAFHAVCQLGGLGLHLVHQLFAGLRVDEPLLVLDLDVDGLVVARHAPVELGGDLDVGDGVGGLLDDAAVHGHAVFVDLDLLHLRHHALAEVLLRVLDGVVVDRDLAGDGQRELLLDLVLHRLLQAALAELDVVGRLAEEVLDLDSAREARDHVHVGHQVLQRNVALGQLRHLHLVGGLLRAVEEFLERVEDRRHVERGVEDAVDARVVVEVREVKRRLAGVADHRGEDDLDEGVEPRHAGVVRADVDVGDVLLVHERRERRADRGDGGVVLHGVAERGAVALDELTRDVLAVDLHFAAQLRLVGMLLDLAEEREELLVRLEHLLVLGDFVSAALGPLRLAELLKLFGWLHRQVFVQTREGESVLVALQVLLPEHFHVEGVVSGRCHELLDKVLDDVVASGCGIVLLVERVKGALDLEAAQGLVKVDPFPVPVLGAQHDVQKLSLLAGVEVLEVGVQRPLQRLADRPVVRARHVGAPGKRQVDHVVEFLDSQAAFAALGGEAHVSLVRGVHVVHRRAELVQRMRPVLCIQG